MILFANIIKLKANSIFLIKKSPVIYPALSSLWLFLLCGQVEPAAFALHQRQMLHLIFLSAASLSLITPQNIL